MASIQRFLAEEDGPLVVGQSKRRSNTPHPSISTNLTQAGPPSKDLSGVSKQTSDGGSTSLSTSPSPSILSRQESRSSTRSSAPSEGAPSLNEQLATMSIRGRNIVLPCLLRDIIDCSVTFLESERELWISHSVSHYGAAGPPSHALCVFCNTVFDSMNRSSPWSDRMNHVADHFVNGSILENSRPDFRVLEDMRNKSLLSEEDFIHCFRYTERPPVDGLCPHDYIPEEIKEKRRAAEEKANRIIVTVSREERQRYRGKKPAVARSKKSKSKPVVEKPT